MPDVAHVSDASDAFVLRSQDAERIALPHGGAFHLYADASHTSGAFGVNRLVLGEGADGARPHYHAVSAEAFYVLDGVAQFLLDGALTTVPAGGLVVVPPGLPHAFGAAPGSTAELLVVLAPGVERFGYFRALGRIQHGELPFASLLPEQDRYDVHFLDAAPWEAARARGVDRPDRPGGGSAAR
ncbi:cupin domain-containing protein [Allostreptomyces psammosilenae]|uniref:Quercetin dioxygenase-like cupin family protein n=1 Tax=Allostreptomyces psammosilenae TaxID=1892865 RepID=A0A852ZS70_9ACTN|nr:cupin domain-containing protein [Allostreptomyces psammosilenae]NYI04665.1 quercetin dioxygenase-like cupin family protein [Allostreptomyces psammosilenae]